MVSYLSELLSICQKPITADSYTSLDKIISTLLKKNISRILLTKDDSNAGIITEKDIGLFLLSDDSEKNLSDIPASQLMNMFTSVDGSMSVEKCVEIMLGKKLALWESHQAPMDL